MIQASGNSASCACLILGGNPGDSLPPSRMTGSEQGIRRHRRAQRMQTCLLRGDAASSDAGAPGARVKVMRHIHFGDPPRRRQPALDLPVGDAPPSRPGAPGFSAPPPPPAALRAERALPRIAPSFGRPSTLQQFCSILHRAALPITDPSTAQARWTTPSCAWGHGLGAAEARRVGRLARPCSAGVLRAQFESKNIYGAL